MKVLKISPNVWDNDSRDQRELSALNELCIECTVIAKGTPCDKGTKKVISGFNAYMYSTKPLGTKAILAPLNKVITLFQWAGYAKKSRADIISCHDLPALLIGWLSTWFTPRAKRPKLVYDSHEFEIGRTADRSRFAKLCVLHLERFLIKRCAFSIMVNGSIADEVQKIHKLKQRPIVVRSTPPYWYIDESTIKRMRREFLSRMGVPEDTFTIMYHGGIMKNRGIESVIEVAAMNPYIASVILGNGEEQYLESLKALAKERGVTSRILFHPAVPIGELWQYVGAADVGVITIPAVSKSYYYMLPNKFFENIQSVTPIICSDFPEVKKLIDKYEIGLTCNPENLDEINKCVEHMRTDKTFYAACKNNLQKAKEELCWEKEKEILKQAYRMLEFI